MNGRIFEIKRFAVHDGDGIRTTVFFKGCPLRCVWCHNPEGLMARRELAYYPHKCASCGECVNVCLQSAHKIFDTGHIFDREKCVACGKCESVCYSGAIKTYGKDVTVEKLLATLLEDREFYENSGGGVTLSGGECLMQADFLRELLIALKNNGIHTAIDTCGYAMREALDKVIDYTDIFLYDLKAYDEDVHISCTGVSNKIILENLLYLDALGKPVEIRIPYVPAYNSQEMAKLADFIKTLKNVTRVRVLPYHSYATSKYAALDIKSMLPQDVPSKDEIKSAEALFNRG